MNEWFKDWFASEEYLEVYSHRDNAEAKLLIDFILSEISIPQDAVILDAACGAGRHSKVLSDNGLQVFGFDLSIPLLKIAKNSLKRNNVNSQFICSDLRNVCLNQKFDLIVNLFTSFGYFNDDAENTKFVEYAFDMLTHKGYYVLDYLNPVFIGNNLVAQSKKTVGGKEILEDRKIVNGRVEKIISIKGDSGIKKFMESVKLYTFSEVESLFAKIGFKIFKSFGDYYGNKFDENKSVRMLIMFEK